MKIITETEVINMTTATFIISGVAIVMSFIALILSLKHR